MRSSVKKHCHPWTEYYQRFLMNLSLHLAAMETNITRPADRIIRCFNTNAPVKQFICPIAANNKGVRLQLSQPFINVSDYNSADETAQDYSLKPMP